MLIDSPVSKRPTLSEADAILVATQKPGVLDISRIPEVFVQDFFNTVGWTSAGGTVTVRNGESNHPGIVRLTTGAVSGNSSAISSGTAATSLPLFSSNVVGVRFVGRITDATNVCIYFGLFGTNQTSARFGNNSILLEYDTAVGTNWNAISNNAGAVSSVTHTSGPVANTWFTLDIIRTSATAMQFYVNDALVGTITNNIPSQPVGFGATVITRTTAARILDLDLARIELYQSNRA